MKKSSLVTMILGTISGVMFAIGMCMTIIPEWNTFQTGIIFGCLGILLGISTIIIWRKMERKQPIKMSGKIIIRTIVGIVGSLILGVGMCFCMIWEQMILGIIIGFIGIFILLSLIPLIKGIK